jgi:hypothetical protein
MENEVVVSDLKINFSFIRIFSMLLLFLFPADLFGVDSTVIGSSNSSTAIELNEVQNNLYRTEPWRIGVTEILLNIEDPQSNDYLVLNYLNSLIREQLKLFKYHIFNDKEVEYLLQQKSTDNVQGKASDDELFSMVYNNSLAYLRNREEVNLSDTSSFGNSKEESIIEFDRILVTIVINENDILLPYIDFSDTVNSLVVSRSSQLESIICSELEKIGGAYIFRMFKLSPLISNPIMLLEHAFTINNLQTISEKTLDALSIGVGGYKRSILEINTDISDVQVFIANRNYSNNDLELSVLPSGEYEITIYSEMNSYYEKKIYTLEPGTITTIVPIIPVPEEKVFLLSIYPFNATIIDESQNNVDNPAELHSLSSEFILYTEAEGYISQNIVGLNELYIDTMFTSHLRPEWMGLDIEINYGQVSFYNSFAAAIISLPATIIFYGLNLEYNFPFYETALGLSLAINFSLLLDTIISLVDYYNRTEVL